MQKEPQMTLKTLHREPVNIREQLTTKKFRIAVAYPSRLARSLGKIQTVRIFNLSFPEMGVDLSGVFPTFA
jgi:hypothetical protein